jgi:transposase InsO family protein
VNGICKLFGVSKQAYYKHDENAALLKVVQEEFVLQYIREIREKDRGIGGLKLWYMYRKAFGTNNPVGRDRFENIIDRYGLKVRTRVRRRPRTTDSSHALPVYPNIVKDFIPTAPDQLWVSDITYITLLSGQHDYTFCYLSLIMDAYTEEIIGWSVGPTLETSYPLEALGMALKRLEGKDNVNLIHHSDRGCQYASHAYVSILQQHHVRVSMTGSGDPKENAQAERVNNTMKNELLRGIVLHDIDEARATVTASVKFYNNERPHMSINMMTPSEAAGCSGEISKRWKSYRLIAIKSRHDGSSITGNGLPLPGDRGAPAGNPHQSTPGRDKNTGVNYYQA